MSKTARYQAYLTIDDSPSAITDELIDFLYEREIPALIFCRGDHLAANPAPIIRAIEKGFLIGNHLYSHQRANRLSFDDICEEIDRTEQLIEHAYKQASIVQPLKTLRFPYLDRGMGAWFVAPSSIDNAQERAIYEHLIKDGLGNNHENLPTKQQLDKKQQLQDFLKKRGYRVPAFEACIAPWYRNNTDIRNAHDTLITCSSSDWMLTTRHLGNWPHTSLKDLHKAMMKDFERDTGSAQILLLHDQAELKNIFFQLVDGLQANNVEFLKIELAQ